MIRTLGSFVGELREVGLPVSTAEALDAGAALQVVDIGDKQAVREALAATLVKVPRHRRSFDVAFDVFFGIGSDPIAIDEEIEAARPADGAMSVAGRQVDGLLEQIAAALRSGDGDALRRAVRQAVSRLSGFQPGRPVGGRYYLYRVMQRLDGLEELLTGEGGPPGLAERLHHDDVAALMERFRSELRLEIVRRLVADRGAEQVARTLRSPLVEDLDLMHATRSELEQIEAAVAPLARKLATRLANRRRRGAKGRLDLRRTIRRSLAHGGALIDPRFRPPRRSKPDIVLLCDVSGSMALFARFTMQLTYAIGNQFSRVRSFAFVDAVDEVTGFFGPGVDFAASMSNMSQHASVVGHDGHSDYGAVLRGFEDRYLEAITPQTTLIVTGDARNNFRDAEETTFAGIARRARSVVWLNPEARRYWDTGDSIMSRYRWSCDSVNEVRTLRQLEAFVEEVALPVHRPSATNAFRGP